MATRLGGDGEGAESGKECPGKNTESQFLRVYPTILMHACIHAIAESTGKDDQL